jgi:hypothetical protein
MARNVLIGAVAVALSGAAGIWVGSRLRAHPVPSAPAVAGLGDTATVGSGRERARAAAPRPPKLAPANPEAYLTTDPRDPRYAASRLADARVERPERIFAAEPRDPGWAPVMEATMSQFVRGDLQALVPSRHETTIECRTQTCRLTVRVDDPEDLAEASFALQIGTLGKTVHFGSQRHLPRGTLEVYAMADETSRDPSRWRQYNQTMRKLKLADLRAARPEDLPVAQERLPLE